MAENPKNALPAGHVVDKYRIEGVLGVGGFGIVYRACHQELGEVAIKEYLPPDMAVREGTAVQPLSSGSRGNFDEGLRRFLEEARRLVQFNHPNVVRCRDFFRANGTAYLVMDFEDGLPLSELLQRREDQSNPLNVDEIKQVILPLLDGLAVVHKHGVLHRDIKPGNIFIRRSTEEPVLLDFGAAKHGFSEHSKSVWAYTQGYAPMEQIEQGGELGPWTDIYAVGAVMWRIVAGDNPPRAEDRMSAKVRGKPDPMKPAADIGEGRYPIAILHAIDRCLSLQEKDRYQSAADLYQTLQKAEQHLCQREKPTQTVKFAKAPLKTYKSLDQRVVMAVAGIALAATLIGLLIAYNRTPTSNNGSGNPTTSIATTRQTQTQLGDSDSRAPGGITIATSPPMGDIHDGRDNDITARQLREAATQFPGAGVVSRGGQRIGVPALPPGPIRGPRASGAGVMGRAYPLDPPAPDAISTRQQTSDANADDVDYIGILRTLAENGDVDSQFNLGRLYFAGEDVSRDYSEALRWWRRAAEQGHAAAQHILGLAYNNGEGVSRDYREAYIWYSLAAANGYSESADRRDEMASRLSSTELSAAQSEARRRSEAMSQSP